MRRLLIALAISLLPSFALAHGHGGGGHGGGPTWVAVSIWVVAGPAPAWVAPP